MAYFRVDARHIKSETAEEEDVLAADDTPEVVVGSRPNLVASFPPHVQLRLRRRGADRRRHARTSISSMKRPALRFASGAIALRDCARRTAAGAASASGPPTGAVLAALSQPPTQSSLASQRIYFVMPDRYANGDTANDTGGLSGPTGVTGFDPSSTGYYHGGDLKGLTAHLQRIKDLGFTAHLGHAGAQAGPGRERDRRLPRLLGPRLHHGRSTPRHGPGLHELRRLGARARPQGLSRRRRQPHRGRRSADERRRRTARSRIATATASGSVRRTTSRRSTSRASRRRRCPRCRCS